MRHSCISCIYIYKEPFGVCKKYREAMIKHNYWRKDFIKELKKLQELLASKCFDYKEE